MLIIYFVLKLSGVSPIFKQERLGRFEQKFTLYKFRTLSKGTKEAPTHEINNPDLVPFGRVLRRTKLDELPQLFNVLKNEMSLVGPRPCLLSQLDLIEQRQKLRIFNELPGITGLAQIQGIDMSNPKLLAEIDAKMIMKMNVINYLKYLFQTIYKGHKDNLSK